MTDLTELNDWMDQHHITVVRTHATNLDGTGIGKHLNRKKFISYLPKGHGVSDIAMAMDRSGNAHLNVWHPQRQANLGDIFLKPDLDTLIYDGADPDLGHCIADFTDADGNPMELCPRSMLKRLVAQMAERNLYAKCTFELEFFLFEESYADLRASKYQRQTPVTAVHQGPGFYNIRSSYLVKPFMKELVRRMEWQGIEWESWNDENAQGQVELNLVPLDPVKMADTVVRIKQMVFEVSQDLGQAATFMAKVGPGFSNGLHVHHSLANADGESVFYDGNTASGRSPLMERWLAGLVKTLPGSVSLLCPSINAYRRFSNFTAVPTVQAWGEDNKSTALRVLGGGAGTTRIEHRLAAGDANPYLVLAAQFAGGLAGLNEAFELPPVQTGMAWGLPPSDADLPMTIRSAAATIKQDDALKSVLGADFIDYWAKTREMEWLQFHTEGGDPQSIDPTLWEYQRYFEHA